MKKLLVSVCAFFIGLNAYSQSVFTYEPKKDLVLGVVALGVFASPFFVNNEPVNVPVGLVKEDVNAFDRSLMFSYNKPLDVISDYGVYALLALPVISLAGQIKDKKAWLTYGLMYTDEETYIMTQIVYIYVNKNVRITSNMTNDTNTVDGDTFISKWNAMDFTLKTGWNLVQMYVHMTVNGNTYTEETTMGIATKNVPWVFEGGK